MSFQNRDDRDAARAAEDSELDRARQAQREKFMQKVGGGPASPNSSPPPEQSGAPKAATGDVPKKAGAFEFQNRGKLEAYEKGMVQQQDDIRSLQKERYKKFKQDGAPAQRAFDIPTGGGGAAVGRDRDSRGQAPPEENAWYDPFGWFSGGSSSSSGGGGGPGYGGGGGSNRPSGPRIKGMSDLPKPAARG